MSSPYGFRNNRFGISAEELVFEDDSCLLESFRHRLNFFSEYYSSGSPLYELMLRRGFDRAMRLHEEREMRRELISQCFEEKKQKYLKEQHEKDIKKDPEKLLSEKVLEKAFSSTLHIDSKCSPIKDGTQINRISQTYSISPPVICASVTDINFLINDCNAEKSVKSALDALPEAMTSLLPETSQIVANSDVPCQLNEPSTNMHEALAKTDSSFQTSDLNTTFPNERNKVSLDEILTEPAEPSEKMEKESLESWPSLFFKDEILLATSYENLSERVPKQLQAVLKQDLSLRKTIVRVINAVARSLPDFAKLMFGKLFLESPLLLADHDKCAKSAFDEVERWKSLSEGLTSWRSVEFALMDLFISLILEGDNIVTKKFGYDGLAILWSIAAALCRLKTPFAAGLLSEIVAKNGKALAQLYGKQFSKMLNLISQVCIPEWDTTALDRDTNVRSAMEMCIKALNFALKECS